MILRFSEQKVRQAIMIRLVFALVFGIFFIIQTLKGNYDFILLIITILAAGSALEYQIKLKKAKNHVLEIKINFKRRAIIYAIMGVVSIAISAILYLTGYDLVALFFLFLGIIEFLNIYKLYKRKHLNIRK